MAIALELLLAAAMFTAAAVYLWRASGGASGTVTAEMLKTAGCVAAGVWAIGVVVVLKILDPVSPADQRAAFMPGLVAAALLAMAGAVSLAESIATWRDNHRAGYPVKLFFPDWVAVTVWAGVVVGLPLLSALVAAWFMDHTVMTVTQSNEVAQVIAMTVLGEAIVLFAAAAVDVFFLRPRRIARNYASAGLAQA